VILRRGLREPHIAGVTGELAALERTHNRIAIGDLAAGGVDEIAAALHLADHLVDEEMLRLGV
jgi:hypothetical protein